MTEILPGLHLVDGLTPDPSFTTHVYLLKDPGGTWTMIDTGLPGSDPAIRKYLDAHGIEPHSIRKILITHLHLDHVGGLKAAMASTGAKVFSHWIEAGFLRGKPPYIGPGSPPKELVEVDVSLKDGDTIDGGGGLVAYHTPGHTPGHTSYYQPARRILFSGDLFFGLPHGLTLTTPEYTLHTGTAQVSARRVAGLDVDALLTYHGGPFPTGAGPKIQELVRGFH
ncbi:MAG: MBL fold metallo-hydrolase [Thermoplasmata archaeon]|nr:MBL fold metallo-hydrolase [Thermoplasmata archaeon]